MLLPAMPAPVAPIRAGAPSAPSLTAPGVDPIGAHLAATPPGSPLQAILPFLEILAVAVQSSLTVDSSPADPALPPTPVAAIPRKPRKQTEATVSALPAVLSPTLGQTPITASSPHSNAAAPAAKVAALPTRQPPVLTPVSPADGSAKRVGPLPDGDVRLVDGGTPAQHEAMTPSALPAKAQAVYFLVEGAGSPPHGFPIDLPPEHLPQTVKPSTPPPLAGDATEAPKSSPLPTLNVDASLVADRVSTLPPVPVPPIKRLPPQPVSSAASQVSPKNQSGSTEVRSALDRSEPSGQTTPNQSAGTIAPSSVAATPAPSARPAPVSTQVADAIVARASIVQTPGRTEFHLRLEPPELGTIHVHLTASARDVSARLVIQDHVARLLIESQLTSLRQRLAQAGVSLGNLNVAREQNGSRDPHQQTRQDLPAFPATPAAGRPKQVTGVPEAVGSLSRLNVLA
jgi:flagellar hook-length control protein FliK